MKGKKTRIIRFSVAILAIVSIGMGLLKIYSHYISIFRLGPLDYIVAIGAIIGGLAVLSSKVSIVISMVCVAFLIFEIFKALVDFHDFRDVLLCIVAILSLIIPIIKYAKS